MNFICREQVLEILKRGGSAKDAYEIITALPSFPAPNPEMKDGRNVMGQTEEQFWDAVDAQDK